MRHPDRRPARLARHVADPLLVELARDGDVEAFSELVTRHQAAMFRLALRMTGSDADAQDIVQDAFVRAWRSLARFRGQSAFSTWLYRIVTNGCLDAIAARRPSGELHEGYEVPDGDVEHVAEARRRVAGVLAAIGQLPPHQRAALVLRDLQGLSYEELATVLDLNVATAKTRVHRARLKVAELAGEPS